MKTGEERHPARVGLPELLAGDCQGAEAAGAEAEVAAVCDGPQPPPRSAEPGAAGLKGQRASRAAVSMATLQYKLFPP